MGGYGSTRWAWHSRKTQVEECYKLRISTIKANLRLWYSGSVWWSQAGREVARISYRVQGVDAPEFVRLMYTIGAKSEHPIECDYPVRLTTTPLPWSGARYWFICPIVGCGRRVGALYLAPGGRYFTCRHCQKLAYASSSKYESRAWLDIFDAIAADMQATHPGILGMDVKALLDDKTTPHLQQLQIERWERYRALLEYDPHERYFSAGQFCEQSGLYPDDLSRLESARLVLPDTKDGRYRPKLAGWGRKLAYLINDGWTIDEIKAWAKGRWQSPNPRQWPPERKDYFLRSCDKLSMGECA